MAFTAASFAGMAAAKAVTDGKVTPEEMTAAAQLAVSMASEFNAAIAAQGVTDPNAIAVARRILKQAITGKGGDVAKASAFSLKMAAKLLAEIAKLEPGAKPTAPSDII
jgi:hypothetical protein